MDDILGTDRFGSIVRPSGDRPDEAAVRRGCPEQPSGRLPWSIATGGRSVRETTNLLPQGEDDEPRSRRVPISMLEPFGDPDLDDRLTGHPEALGLSVKLLDHP